MPLRGGKMNCKNCSHKIIKDKIFWKHLVFGLNEQKTLYNYCYNNKDDGITKCGCTNPEPKHNPPHPKEQD